MRKLLSTLSSTLQGCVRGGLLLLLALFASVSAIYASNTKVGGIWYDFDSSTKTASVTYRGNYVHAYGGEYSGSVVIPETVTYNGTTYSVTSIGEEAFFECSSLTSVTIPNSVTCIGEYAFYYCYSLTKTNYTGDIAGWCNIKFGSHCANPMYYSHNFYINDQEIKDLVIPNSVTCIGEYAFNGCTSLTSVTIPNSVTSIGNSAFYGCSALTSPIYNAHCFAYMPTSYSGAYTIPEGIEQIAGSAFYGCSSLTSVTIPNSVTSIGDYAFLWCSSLTSVTIPNSVTSIGEEAFRGCNIDSIILSASDIATFCQGNANDLLRQQDITFPRKLLINDVETKEVDIPNSVESIKPYAFYNCIDLNKVSISNNSVKTIGNSAFLGCNIDSIILSASDIATFCQGNTNDLLRQQYITFPRKLLINDVETKEVDIPNSVESINPYAFYNCIDLNKVSISNSVKTIGNSAFYGCSSLSSVAIGNGVTKIGNSAFAGCTVLNLLRLGTGIQSIAANAFAACTKLYDIYCLAAEPPTGYTSSFANYNAFIHVPCESQRLYMLDVLFGEFKYIECIASDEVPTDDIVINPGSTDVTITWPTEEGADTYTIVIKKDGEVVCTLTFNAEGQLLNIAFAPGRDGNHPVQYAEAVANGKGFRFTVTGLEDGTDYTYDITVKDASNQTIHSHTGEFTTQSTTAVDNITTNNANIQKIMRNGQLIIIRNGVEYNAVGQEM